MKIENNILTIEGTESSESVLEMLKSHRGEGGARVVWEVDLTDYSDGRDIDHIWEIQTTLTDVAYVKGTMSQHVLEEAMHCLAEAETWIVEEYEDSFLTVHGPKQLFKNQIEFKKRQQEVSESSTPGETAWGGYYIVEEGDGRQTKLLHLNPGSCMSYQSHDHRDELWNVVRGDLWMCIDGQDVMYSQGENFVISQGEKHAAFNRSGSTVEVIEIWMGNDLREDDIHRHEYTGFLYENNWDYGSGNILD